ncbi:MAG: hypothetical protein ACKO96_30980, partial [Flammeovirgaceae bacterium]
PQNPKTPKPQNPKTPCFEHLNLNFLLNGAAITTRIRTITPYAPVSQTAKIRAVKTEKLPKIAVKPVKRTEIPCIH